MKCLIVSVLCFVILVTAERNLVKGNLDLGLSNRVSATVNLITDNPVAGSPLQIDCATEGPPESKITWHFEDTQLITDDRRRILSNHTLSITEARTSDSGEYRCTVQYGFNMAAASVYVQVKNSKNKKLVEVEGSGITATYDEEMEKFCKNAGCTLDCNRKNCACKCF